MDNNPAKAYNFRPTGTGAGQAGPQYPSTGPSAFMSPTQFMPTQQAGLPTGVPMGPTYTGTTPTNMPVTTPVQGMAPSPTQMLGVPTTPQILDNPAYFPGFLKTQIGKRVRVEFLIGTSTMTDRTGILIGVGSSYILLRDETEDNIIMCDLYSIKFVTFLL